ncbi:MAG TPA: hypothetical protein VF329_03490 [Gammaproteobacteria bacterium]
MTDTTVPEPENRDREPVGSLLEIIDGVRDRLRFASGVLALYLESSEHDEPDRDAIAGADEHLSEAAQLVDRLEAMKDELRGKRAAPADWLNQTRTVYERDRAHAEQEGLGDEQVAEELRRHLWYVDRILAAGELNDDYRVSYTCTAKGLRAFLGERRFMERLHCDDPEPEPAA